MTDGAGPAAGHSADRPRRPHDDAGSEVLLEVTDLSVEFATDDGTFTAINGVSFRIRPGETVVLVGESGSGKSVTSLAILRLLLTANASITSGTVNFHRRRGDMVDLRELPERAMRAIRGNEIAMIFQEPTKSLDPVFTIGQQISEAIVTHRGVDRSEAGERAAKLLHKLGIPNATRRLKSYPHELSGGMQQRVMIAMALACHPALLIADEPTTALDVTIQAQIIELMRELQNELGMAVLFITHDLAVAAEIADRIVVMYAGRVVEEGPARAVLKQPRMPYTRGLLKSVPRLGARQGALVSIPGSVPDPAHLPLGCAFHPRCEHAQPGRCDTAVPPFETCGPDHRVRCVRWRELAPGGPG